MSAVKREDWKGEDGDDEDVCCGGMGSGKSCGDGNRSSADDEGVGCVSRGSACCAEQIKKVNNQGDDLCDTNIEKTTGSRCGEVKACGSTTESIKQDGDACCTEDAACNPNAPNESSAPTNKPESSDRQLDKTQSCLKSCCKSNISPENPDSCANVDRLPSQACTEKSLEQTVPADFHEACSTHLRQAIAKYTSYLEAGICICRNALNRIDTCCDGKKRAAISRKRKSWNGSNVSVTRLVEKRLKNEKGDVVVGEQCERSCCSSKVAGTRKVVGCCGPDGGINVGNDACRKEKDDCKEKRDVCCKSGAAIRIEDTQGELSPTVLPKAPLQHGLTPDIEQSAAREHVSFSIVGMTCTGCVKKINGILDHIDGVNNVRINFVATMGELDVDTTNIETGELLQRLERETGFKCSRIVSSYQTLDVLLSRNDARSLSMAMPNGMVSIEQVNGAYQLTFDPLTIGAREVLARSGGTLAPPSSDNALAEGRRRFILKLWSFGVAAAFTIPVVVLAWGNTKTPYTIRSVVSLILATFVQAIAVPEFYTPALKALIFSKSIEMDMLVVISITAAYGYSVAAFSLTHAGLKLEQGEIFETSTLLITLVLLGRLVSSYAKNKAVQAVSMRSLQTDTAFLENLNGSDDMIDVRLLEFNDVFRVPPHSKIVSDGHIVRGETAVDESIITGESLPVPKSIGDKVIAGTMNGPGPISVRLTRLPGQNSITDIANLVQNALAAKPHIQDLADVVAGWFVPVVIGISLVVLAVWLVVALKVRGDNAGGAVGLSITYSIAVLAISCPCALGLAVPLVLVIAGGVASRAGVIIKDANATERAHKVTDVIFDKTGTLTDGNLHVVLEEMHAEKISHGQAVSLAYSLVKDNDHPVSRAITTTLQARSSVPPLPLKNIKSIPGCGILATWNTHSIRLGNSTWLNITTHPTISHLLSHNLILTTLTLNDTPILTFALQSHLRPEAPALITALKHRNITPHILSGDHLTTVSSLATTLTIPLTNVRALQSPLDKQTYITHLNSQPGKTTLFIGDGTNDAPALATAHVSVAIVSATSTSSLSSATSSVVFLTPNLTHILTLLDISRAAYRRILFNFIWSAVYNVFAILLAAGAFVRVRIEPGYAGVGEIVSVLPVVLVAASLWGVKGRRKG